MDLNGFLIFVAVIFIGGEIISLIRDIFKFRSITDIVEKRNRVSLKSLFDIFRKL